MRTVSFFLLLVLILSGCGDPARDNPFDPGSSTYNPRATLSVTVKNRIGIALENIPIYVSDRYAATNSDGIATFTLQIPQTYPVIAGGNKYDFDTMSIALAKPESRQLEFRLNGVPQFASLSLFSELRQPGGLRSTLHVIAKVYDPDSNTDIDSVWINTPYGNIRLNYATDSTWRISRDTLPQGYDIVNLVGYPVVARVTDRSGGIGETTSRLPRVFIGNPTITMPTPDWQMFTEEFYVQWYGSVSERFQHTYRVLIYTYNTTDTLLKEDNIPQTTERLDLFNRLNVGVYTVEVLELDAFGSFSRSARVNFSLVSNNR